MSWVFESNLVFGTNLVEKCLTRDAYSRNHLVIVMGASNCNRIIFHFVMLRSYLIAKLMNLLLLV